MFSPRLSSAIEVFLDNNINPLADALAQNEKEKAQEEVHKQFQNSPLSDVVLALDTSGDKAAARIAEAEIRPHLEQQKQSKDKLEAGFIQAHLGRQKEEIDIEGQCFWVPASVRHEIRSDTAGRSRHSFFVYGGVSIQPRINVVAGGNGPLRGSSVGGGAFNRNDVTRGFQSHHIVSPTNKATKNHELLGFAGFNNKSDMNSRVNRIFLPVNRAQHPGTVDRPGRSLHNGRHTQDAMDLVANKMDRVVRTGQAQKWSQPQYRSAFRAMVAECRQELRTGQANLYAKHVPSTKSK